MIHSERVLQRVLCHNKVLAITLCAIQCYVKSPFSRELILVKMRTVIVASSIHIIYIGGARQLLVNTGGNIVHYFKFI